jgi:hypothetical protein
LNFNHGWTRIFQARRAGIFVDYGHKTNQAPFRSGIIGICRPDGAEILFGLWFYKDAAPTALGTCSVGAVQPGNSGGALVDDRGPAMRDELRGQESRMAGLSFLESVPDVSTKLKAPVTADRKFEDVVKSAQGAAVLVLVY